MGHTTEHHTVILEVGLDCRIRVPTEIKNGNIYTYVEYIVKPSNNPYYFEYKKEDDIMYIDVYQKEKMLKCVN